MNKIFSNTGLLYEIMLRDEGDDKVTTIVAEENIPQVKEVVMTDKEVTDYRVTLLCGLLGIAVSIIAIVSFLYFIK